MFDAYLQQRGRQDGKRYRAFGIDADYLRHVDGKLRHDGVRSFLDSRGIQLPQGHPSNPPAVDTVCSLGNRKDALFQQLLQRDAMARRCSNIRSRWSSAGQVRQFTDVPRQRPDAAADKPLAAQAAAPQLDPGQDRRDGAQA